jgi:hypothetical protein
VRNLSSNDACPIAVLAEAPKARINVDALLGLDDLAGERKNHFNLIAEQLT